MSLYNYFCFVLEKTEEVKTSSEITQVRELTAEISNNMYLSNDLVVDPQDPQAVVVQEMDSDDLQTTPQYSAEEVVSYAELTPVEAGISKNMYIGDELVFDPQEKVKWSSSKHTIFFRK